MSTILSIIAVKNNFNLDFIVDFTHRFQLQTYLVLLEDKLIVLFFFLGMSESPFADSCSRIPGTDSDPGRQPPLLNNNNNKHNFLSLDRRTCLFYERVGVRCP